jgi:hypothetical protein
LKLRQLFDWFDRSSKSCCAGLKGLVTLQSAMMTNFSAGRWTTTSCLLEQCRTRRCKQDGHFKKTQCHTRCRDTWPSSTMAANVLLLQARCWLTSTSSFVGTYIKQGQSRSSLRAADWSCAPRMSTFLLCCQFMMTTTGTSSCRRLACHQLTRGQRDGAT